MYRCQDCLKEFEVPSITQLVYEEDKEIWADDHVSICPNCGSDFVIEELGEQR